MAKGQSTIENGKRKEKYIANVYLERKKRQQQNTVQILKIKGL